MTTKLLTMSSAMAIIAGMAHADAFNRIASFPTFLNNADVSVESSAEIISATEDGMTLVYSDSPLGVIGIIDISDPSAPAPMGCIDVGGEPTAVSVIGNTAFVGVNTLESFTAPSGLVKAFDLTTMEQTAACDLGGQPDSTATAPDGSFIAIAIENERDEDLGDGRVGQAPAGFLVTVDVAGGTLDCGTLNVIDVTGLTDIAPEDPEPEFVDINTQGEIVVTLRENNHIVVANKDGDINHFSAGSIHFFEFAVPSPLYTFAICTNATHPNVSGSFLCKNHRGVLSGALRTFRPVRNANQGGPHMTSQIASLAGRITV